MTRIGPLTALALLLATSVACTAARATIDIVNAEATLKKAEQQSVQKVAIYEYTLALRYLEKAKEESAFSDFRVASEFAKKSASWSDKAIIFVQTRGKTLEELESIDDLPDAPVPAPGVAPVAPSGPIIPDDEPVAPAPTVIVVPAPAPPAQPAPPAPAPPVLSPPIMPAPAAPPPAPAPVWTPAPEPPK